MGCLTDSLTLSCASLYSRCRAVSTPWVHPSGQLLPFSLGTCMHPSHVEEPGGNSDPALSIHFGQVRPPLPQASLYLLGLGLAPPGHCVKPADNPGPALGSRLGQASLQLLGLG